MIDKQLIRNKFVRAKPYLNKIDELGDEQEFLNDIDTLLKAERIFEILAQIILDICTHISSRSEFGVPNT